MKRTAIAIPSSIWSDHSEHTSSYETGSFPLSARRNRRPLWLRRRGEKRIPLSLIAASMYGAMHQREDRRPPCRDEVWAMAVSVGQTRVACGVSLRGSRHPSARLAREEDHPLPCRHPLCTAARSRYLEPCTKRVSKPISKSRPEIALKVTTIQPSRKGRRLLKIVCVGR
jgi:hypothetical protein